jgi:chitinase
MRRHHHGIPMFFPSKMVARSRWLAFVLPLTMLACSSAGSSGEEDDAAPITSDDTGTTPHDTGVARDTGTAPGKDAAPGSDAAIATDGATASDTAPSTDGATTSDTASAIDGATATDSAVPVDAAPAPSKGRLVAYYANWTRTTMPPKSIPWKNVTHIAHSFILPGATGGLRNMSTYVDAELISEAHAHGVKVIASVGGAGANFDANVTSSVRAKTVADMAILCKTYGYDGIDLDWEFPETTAQGTAWAAMVSELRIALDAVRPGLTISAAVASGSYYASWLPTSGLKALSWVGVMTYDYSGAWSATSGHDSPLYPSKGGDGGSVSESMDYFITKRGLPSENVLLGLPFYGQQFGASTIASTPVAPAAQPDYKDIVTVMGTAGWTKSWDDAAKVPYLHRSASPGFLSYDDVRSIGEKCAYGKSRAVGGAIVWHLAGDRLSDGTNPLLEAAQPCR